MLLSNLFFLLGANWIALSAGFTIEHYMRKDYLQRKIILAEQEKMDSEIRRAGLIQRAILPDDLVFRSDMLHIYGHYLPMQKIGGDFYDFMDLGNGHFGVLMADVSGHGIPAALISSMLKVSFQSAMHLGKKPRQLLKKINTDLTDNTAGVFISAGKTGGIFITAVYLYLDLNKKRAVVAQAGHPPVLVLNRDGGKIREYKPSGLPVGVSRETVFEEIGFDISDNDRIFLYTDGLLESLEALYGESVDSHVASLLHDSRNIRAEKFMNFTLSRLDKLGTPEDDIAMIIIECNLS